MGVDEIATAVDGTIVTGKEPVDISDLGLTTVSSDSRDEVSDGLFVALKGERVDGHDFLGSAAAHGFAVALVDHEVQGAPILQIEVADTVTALGKLAQHNIVRRRQMNAPFSLVGITGSVGKTTTKDITKALLSFVAPTVAPVGSFNNNLGLPLTALKVDEKTRYFIAEMGANHLGEIRDLTHIAPPDISVVLKVGNAHLGEFGSVENIFIAKSEIVEALTPDGIAILNSDDVNVTRMRDRTQAGIVWFGLDATRNDLAISATDIEVDDLDRPSFTVLTRGKPAGNVHMSLSGRHNVMNALAALAIATTLGMKIEQAIAILSGDVSLSPHRMAVSEAGIDMGGGAGSGAETEASRFTLIDDSFNANPDSMKSGIDGLARTHEAGYHVAVLGPMLELGAESVQLHSQVGAYAVHHGVDALVSVGVAPSDVEGAGEAADLPSLAKALGDGAEHEVLASSDSAADSKNAEQTSVFVVHSLDEASRVVARLASTHPDTVVLLKGSHASGVGKLADMWRVTASGSSAGEQGMTMTSTDGE
jgi:UDP-N-acetylmuramoyl-tripeptide--D-alanyl-D-alanine ligase